jgi:hypothetical protein
MAQEMSEEQRRVMQGDLALVQRLLALAGVSQHDTRFQNEVALVAATAALPEVEPLVQEVMGQAVKPAEAELPEDFEPRGLLAAMGGVRRGQTLYLKSATGGLFLYVAYWPWGSGAKVTVKIGVFEDAGD